MELLNVQLVGIAPLMMHSEKLANPLALETKEYKKVSQKRGKTDEDHALLMQLEWRAGLYTDDKGEPCLPAANVLATLIQGAKRFKRGPAAKTILADSQYFRLEYEGSRSPGELYLNERFVDFRSVGVQKAKTMRCRPIFPEWTATGTLLLDGEQHDAAEVLEWLRIAGSMIGVGDHRPQYGRFEVQKI